MSHTVVFEWSGDNDNQLLGLADEDVRRLAERAQGFAQRVAPVGTGALAASIKSERVSESHYRVGSDLDYAAPVELGYRHHGSGKHIPAQPYLRPALDAVRAELL